MKKYILVAAALATMTTAAHANKYADDYAAEARETLKAAENGNCITHDVIDDWLDTAYSYVAQSGSAQDKIDVFDLYAYVNYSVGPDGAYIIDRYSHADETNPNNKVCEGNIEYAQGQLDQVNDALSNTGPNTDPAVISDLRTKKATLEAILASLNS